MMAQPYPAHAGMGPGHPGMPHGHPMGGVHHPGGQMGHANPAMMQGMHPGMSGPQVTQGPMASVMPPNPSTPAPGGPMPNPMAMAHMGGPQGPMFQGQNPQMNLGQQMQMNQAQMLAQRQKAMMAQQGGQIPPGMMNMQNMPQFSQAQIAQMRMGMPMQQMAHMTPQQQQALHQQQQFQQQQRMMAQQAHVQQQQAIARQQAQQANAGQQSQMQRPQEPTTQPPQPQPTPAPQAQPQAPPQNNNNNNQQAQQTPQPQPKPQPQQANNQPQQAQNAPTPQVKQGEQEEEPQIKPELAAQHQQMMMQELSKQGENFTGQCILQLLLYQDNLANPELPNDLGYWDRIIHKYFSPLGSIRQQVFNQKTSSDKSFQLQFPSLARFYHSHFKNGIKQILMQSFDHNQSKLPHGGVHIWSEKASLTYVFRNDLRITTQGSLRVTFDDMQKIEHLNIATTNWVEYIPRTALLNPLSPEQSKQSPKLKKNQPKNQQRPGQSGPNIPSTGCTEWGLPEPLLQFLEIAEVMTAMGPLMQYFHDHPGLGPRESLMRINAENNQLQRSVMAQAQAAQAQAQAQAQNAGAMAANGQIQFPNQRMGMNPPNQFQSPALSHLGLPQGQGSPHMGGPNHTPSPAQNPQGGVAMMHQMSAQGSNLSGSAGASTNTSPNVSNKRRRASAIKSEEENQQAQAPDGKVKPSPRIGGKRQKGAAS